MKEAVIVAAHMIPAALFWVLCQRKQRAASAKVRAALISEAADEEYFCDLLLEDA